MLSGNTDCYQPIERKLGITRQLLEICLAYQHPVSILTKNSLIERDMDLLVKLADKNLVHVGLSITSLDNSLRSCMEPRTASVEKKLAVMKRLSTNNIPVVAMIAPIIPGLNNHEIPAIVKSVANNGANAIGYTTLRLNGEIGPIFENWIKKTYPQRANKVLHQIKEMNGGQLESKGKNRLKREGQIHHLIKNMIDVAKKKYLRNAQLPEYDLTLFQRPSPQLRLF